MSGSPSIASLFAQRVVVGVGDMATSNNASVTLSTYALGSCVGLIVFDPAVKAGGLIHIMLPDSSVSPQKAETQPAMFADTGLPVLMKTMLGLRAEIRRMKAYVAGGASVLSGSDLFKIGDRNISALKTFVVQYGIHVIGANLGGINNRTIHLNIGTGEVTLKSPVENRTLSLQ